MVGGAAGRAWGRERLGEMSDEVGITQGAGDERPTEHEAGLIEAATPEP